MANAGCTGGRTGGHGLQSEQAGFCPCGERSLVVLTDNWVEAEPPKNVIDLVVLFCLLGFSITCL